MRKILCVDGVSEPSGLGNEYWFSYDDTNGFSFGEYPDYLNGVFIEDNSLRQLKKFIDSLPIDFEVEDE